MRSCAIGVQSERRGGEGTDDNEEEEEEDEHEDEEEEEEEEEEAEEEEDGVCDGVGEDRGRGSPPFFLFFFGGELP